MLLAMLASQLSNTSVGNLRGKNGVATAENGTVLCCSAVTQAGQMDYAQSASKAATRRSVRDINRNHAHSPAGLSFLQEMVIVAKLGAASTILSRLGYCLPPTHCRAATVDTGGSQAKGVTNTITSKAMRQRIMSASRLSALSVINGGP